jgi:hypothetical protein
MVAKGINGPVVVWLYPEAPLSQPIPGSFNDALAKRIVELLSGAHPESGPFE